MKSLVCSCISWSIVEMSEALRYLSRSLSANNRLVSLILRNVADRQRLETEVSRFCLIDVKSHFVEFSVAWQYRCLRAFQEHSDHLHREPSWDRTCMLRHDQHHIPYKTLFKIEGSQSYHIAQGRSADTGTTPGVHWDCISKSTVIIALFHSLLNQELHREPEDVALKVRQRSKLLQFQHVKTVVNLGRDWI